MKRWISVILAVLLIAALAAGCGKAEEPAAPAADKELVVGLTTVNSNFDPYGSYGDETYGHMQVYDTLVIKDKDGKMAPSLAEFQMAADGLSYTFNIKKGVLFSDGSEFKAADAKFSIDKGIASSFTNWAMTNVAGCDVVDDYTVKVNLKKADVSCLEKLTWINMVSESAYTKYGEEYGKTQEAVVGTGPYVLSAWQPGQECSFTANENYFAGAPGIKKVKFKSISDPNAAVIALQTGEIGLYLGKDVPGMAVATLQSSDKVSVTTFPSYVFMDVLMNCETGPFTDLKLRQAVAYAVDRTKMMTVGTEGQGTLVDYPGGPDYVGNPGVKSWYVMDIEKAKALVAEAGMAGKTVTIKTMATDPWPKLATALQDDLGKIGLTAKVEQLEMNAYSQDVWQKANYEIAISRYWSGTKDMSETMSLLETGGSMNFSRYSNPAIDPYLSQAAATMDEAQRKSLYTEAIKIFHADVPLIPLYYTQGNRAYSKELAIEPGNVQYDHIYYYNWAQ